MSTAKSQQGEETGEELVIYLLQQTRKPGGSLAVALGAFGRVQQGR